MTAPERRYTDADVRSDPELAELAYDYLDQYGGDFEPLVRAQDVLSEGRLLTTTQTRVVLNCMRHDWNIADQLPTPMGKVIDMPVRETEVVPRPKRKDKVPSWKDRYVDCDRTDYHEPHSYEAKGFDQWRCGGIPNGREDYLWVPARIKTPYAKAKGGKMVHIVAPEGSVYLYYPNRYGDGYGSNGEQWGRFPPRLSVNLLCRYPSVLVNPLLLWEVPEGMLTSEGKPLALCPHCIKERDK
jgi:hypothetical protein